MDPQKFSMNSLDETLPSSVETRPDAETVEAAFPMNPTASVLPVTAGESFSPVYPAPTMTWAFLVPITV